MSWLLSLCVQKPPAAVTDVSSMSGVYVNHGTGTGTSGTRLPHRHQATWHVPGLATRVWDTLHVRGGRGVTGLDWVLLCSVVFRADSSVAAPHQCGWHAASAASAQLAGPTSNIWRAPAFIPSLPGLRIRWTSVHQPRHLDVTVASPCLFIFIQLAWTHNTAACHHHHQPGGQKVD